MSASVIKNLKKVEDFTQVKYHKMQQNVTFNNCRSIDWLCLQDKLMSNLDYNLSLGLSRLSLKHHQWFSSVEQACVRKVGGKLVDHKIKKD